MKSSKMIIKNMFSLTIAEVANKGIVFVFTAYLARVILPEGFGIISFANAILVYFLLFVNLGFNVVGAREISKSQEHITKYANSIITARTVIAFLAYAVLFIVTYFLDKPLLVKQTIWIAGINLFANAILLDWIYQGTEKMEFIAVRQVVTSLLNLIGVVLLVHSKNDVVIAMLVTVISTTLNSIWMLLLYVKMFGKIKFEFDWNFLKPILKSSLPISFSVFSGIIMNTMNTVMLSIFRTEHETGIYNAAYKILLLVIVPSVIIQNAFFPAISRSYTTEERINIIKKFSMLMFLFASILTLTSLTFSDFVITFTFGNKYSDSIVILRMLMITSLLVYYNVFCTVPLNGWNKEKEVMYSIIAGAVVSIVLNIILIPKYGPMGAAIGTISSEVIVGIFLTYNLFKTINKFYLLPLLKFTLFAVISCGLGYLAHINGLQSVFSGILSVLIFALINILFKTVTFNEIKSYFVK
ncbi:MAG: flippase [Ignavibacteriae bacterium]|nr:flippase [Ignavibacteriota bacterium]